MRNRIIGGVVFLVLLVGIGAFGAHQYLSRPDNEPSHIITLTSSNGMEVQAQIDLAGLPVLYIICTPDLCDLTSAFNEAAAVEQIGKVTFVKVNPTELPQLQEAAIQLTGEWVYPTYVYVTEDGAFAETGVKDAGEIAQFIEQATASKVVAMTSANSQQVQASAIPVLYVLCTRELCEFADEELEKVALQYDERVLIVTVDPFQFQQLTLTLAREVGTVALPGYIFVNTDGTFFATAGLMNADQLDEMLTALLTGGATTDTTGGAEPTATPAGGASTSEDNGQSPAATPAATSTGGDASGATGIQ